MKASPDMTCLRLPSPTRRRLPGLVPVALVTLAACSGSGPATVAPPVGQEIETPGIEGYTTQHNGFTRARIDNATTPGDRAILAQFEDANPDSPAGYRNLIAQTEQRYLDNMEIEVIAQVAATVNGERVVRVLRLTADQGPFENVDSRGNLIAKGEFFFRGAAEVYARVDGGALQRGVGELQNMVVDFDKQSVSINLRTPFDPTGGSDIETELTAASIPLNVVTGTFGGPVTVSTRSGDTGEILTSDGLLRGNLNGDAAGLSRLVENMTTSGLFTVGGIGDRFTADGVFWGSQLNYAD
ncbi:viral aspartic protease [Oceaniglobus roseus]|uniref:viral aspartic protease n=1 Tax=Oceaniglobus roseus TaxID=1737570 RepID=UPI001FE7AE5B|nr:viral aspartic protease [Kandeliimicrobium roseum]